MPACQTGIVNSRATPDQAEDIGPVELAWTTHVSTDTELLDRLVSRHRERQRRYHRIEHVEAVLAHVAELAAVEPVDDLGVVVAAALYHDAIYESQHPANERASARLARRDLARLDWSADRIDRVGQMIEGTATHLEPADVATAVLFDADLAILGAAPDDYRVYISRIRDEYGHLDDGEWSAGRAAFLADIVERSEIYATASGRERWEDAARTNLRDELAALAP